MTRWDHEERIRILTIKLVVATILISVGLSVIIILFGLHFFGMP